MSAETAVKAPVRRMPGPFVERICLRTARGFRWVERPRHPGPAYLDEAALDRLRAILPDGAVRPVLPVVGDDGTAIWPAVPTPALLCDGLFDPARGGTADWAVPVFEALGRFLGRLHAISGAGLPNRNQPAWLAADPAAAEAVRTARAALPVDAAPGLAGDAAEVRPPVAPTVVHGRFSSGLCVPGSRPVLLGWREAGAGDPARDVAFLVGEMVEAVAVLDAAVEVGAPRLAALVTGYRACGPRLPGVTAAVADRVLEHYAQGSRWFGAGADLRALLTTVDRRWAGLRPILEELR